MYEITSGSARHYGAFCVFHGSGRCPFPADRVRAARGSVLFPRPDELQRARCRGASLRLALWRHGPLRVHVFRVVRHGNDWALTCATSTTRRHPAARSKDRGANSRCTSETSARTATSLRTGRQDRATTPTTPTAGGADSNSSFSGGL